MSKQKIEKFYKVIADANEEIKELRAKCEHKTSTPSLYSWRPGCIDLKNVCDECGDVVGDPSKKEREQYKKENPDCRYVN